jgi:hypothetical protein
MLTITVGRPIVQDLSWGGLQAVPVPVAARNRRAWRRSSAAWEGTGSRTEDAVTSLSIRLLGCVEITQTRTARRSG